MSIISTLKEIAVVLEKQKTFEAEQRKQKTTIDDLNRRLAFLEGSQNGIELKAENAARTAAYAVIDGMNIDGDKSRFLDKENLKALSHE